MRRPILVFCLVFLATFHLAALADEALPQRQPGSSVIISGQYFCYRLANNHVFCRHCEKCKRISDGPIVVPFDAFLPRAQ